MRHARALAILLALLAALLTVGASAASATPAIPFVPDCKDAPAPAEPGTGSTDVVDPPPGQTPVSGDAFADPANPAIYDNYAYAGLSWHTYDLGCLGQVQGFGATLDTTVGNFLLGAATWFTAVANGLHSAVAHPDRYMGPLDRTVAAVTAQMRASIWSAWGIVALLGLGAMLLFLSMSGRVANVVSSAAWAALVLAVLAGVTAYPQRVSSFFDHSVTSAVSSVNAGAAHVSGTPATGDPTRAQGALLVDDVLYAEWLRGEFGSANSKAAQRWGPALFKASTLSWHEEAEASASADAAKRITDAKAQQWKDTTAQIQEQDPATYAHVQGKAGGRIGTGFMAVIASASTALFRLIADLFLFAGLVMLRLLVMFFPVVAVPGVLTAFSGLVRRVANEAGAAVVNVVAFGTGAVVHTAAVSAIVRQANGAGMSLMALVLCLVLTFAALAILSPLLTFKSILGGARPHRAKALAGQLVRYAAVKHGAKQGIEDGLDNPDGEQLTVAKGRRKQPYREVLLPAEAVGRPRVTQQEIPESERSLPPLVVDSSRQVGSPVARGQTSPRGPARHPGRQDADDLRTTSRTGQVLRGRVVTSLPDDVRVYRTHDSNDEATSDGVGTRIYDPALGRSVLSSDLDDEVA